MLDSLASQGPELGSILPNDCKHEQEQTFLDYRWRENLLTLLANTLSRLFLQISLIFVVCFGFESLCNLDFIALVSCMVFLYFKIKHLDTDVHTWPFTRKGKGKTPTLASYFFSFFLSQPTYTQDQKYTEEHYVVWQDGTYLEFHSGLAFQDSEREIMSARCWLTHCFIPFLGRKPWLVPVCDTHSNPYAPTPRATSPLRANWVTTA